MTTHRNDDAAVHNGAPRLSTDYPHFAPGTKVRDIFGKEHVVIEQVGCAVFMKCGKQFHPTKVFAAE